MRGKILSLAAIFAVGLMVVGAGFLRAQTAPPPDSAPLLAEGDLEQLVAPIALYPDPLIALILPASTVPTDIVLAERFVQNDNDPNDIDGQNWDDSVKGLAHYPDVLQMMDANLDWTNQLGAAVLAQQADVMTAIQAQRAKARALGNLESTPQQEVFMDQQIIQIVPADPQVIYVPIYDPQVVYIERAPAVPFITFGLGFAMGIWIGGDCDWHHHGIYRRGYYRPGYGWRPHSVNITINNNYIWRPNPHKPKPRPPYRPGRPGTPGGGHLPGWHRPPGGNKPPPGKPGGPGHIKPQPKPQLPGNGNRPGGPGGNHPGKPQIQPVPGHTKPVPSHTKPAPGVTHPGTNKPGVTHPGAAKPGVTHPGTTHPAKPVTRPAPGAGQPKPSPQPAKPHIKPATPRPEAKPAPRPAVQKPAAPRPAVQKPAAPAAKPQRPAGNKPNQNN